MFVGFLAALGTASQLHQFHEMFDSSSEPIGLVLAAGVMFAVGAVDDLREVSPPAKVAGQVLSASMLSLFGVAMLYFRVPFASYDYIVLSPDMAALVTIATVVVLANAVNLIDGLDGLAAGIVIIAGAALFLYSDRLFKAGLVDGSNIGPLVAVIAVAICVGFLPHNFNPAKIFMGDAGAMFLGLLLAVTTITVGGRTADQFSGQTYFLLRAAGHPDRDPGRPPHRHGLLVRPSDPASPVDLDRRSRAPAPPAHAPRPRPPPGRGDPLALDRAGLRGRPHPDVHEPGQRPRADRARRAGLAALHLLPSWRSAAPGRGGGRRPRQGGRRKRSSTSSSAAAPVPGRTHPDAPAS